MVQIISGKEIGEEIRKDLTLEVESFKKETGITPGLAVVLVGENPASLVYVGQKEKACEQVGIISRKYALPENASQDEVLNLVDQLNNDSEIHGILVQLPLPVHLNESEILNRVSPQKDVDGFHPVNVGKLLLGEETFVPCTPQGIIELLERTGVEIKGKEAVVVGRSNIVGKPVAILLLQRHATVTICHTRTRDLAFHTKRAEILVVAAGKPHLIKGDMIKEGVVVIDVGVNRVNGKLVGDVDFESAKEVASAITPVPGGVGPMTVTMLLKNTLRAAKSLAQT